MAKEFFHRPEPPKGSPIPPLEEGSGPSFFGRFFTFVLILIILVLGYLYLSHYKTASKDVEAERARESHIRILKEEKEQLKEEIRKRDRSIESLANENQALKKTQKEHDILAPEIERLKREIDEYEQIIITLQADIQARDRTIESLQRGGEEEVGILERSFQNLTPPALGRFPDIYTRAEGIAALKRQGAEAYEFLEGKTKDPDALIRNTAAQALGELGGSRALNVLRRLIDDPSSTVRMSASFWLSLQESPPVLQPLLDSLKSGGSQEKGLALYYLGMLQAPEAVPIAGQLLSHENRSTRMMALSYLLKIEDPSVIPFLKEALTLDEIKNTREGSARQIGKEAVLEALALLGDTSLIEEEGAEGTGLQGFSVQILDILGIPKGISLLREALGKAEDPFARSVAARALGERKDVESFENLTRALKDTSALVRENAALALAQLGKREAIPMLKELLKDKDPSVSNAAARALLFFRDITGIHLVLKGLDDPVNRGPSQRALVSYAGEDLGFSPEDWEERLIEGG